MSNIKIVQIKGKGFINLVPYYKGKVLGQYIISVFPCCYNSLGYETNRLKERLEKYYKK